MKVYLDYKNGHTLPDNRILKYVEDALNKDEDFTIGSELMFLALRVCLKKGLYKFVDKVDKIPVFIVKDKNNKERLIYIKEDGKVNNHDLTLLDKMLDILIDL